MPEAHEHTALIADDDEYFRMALKSILTKLGFTNVIETDSLDSAIDRLSEVNGRVAIALFDLGMPGISSPASLRAVKEVYPRIKIAVVSGSTKKTDIMSAIETGVNGYVPKVLGAKQLSEALKLILGGIVYVPPLMADGTASEAEPSNSTMSESDQKQVLEKLTPRQVDVLKMLVDGKATKEIAAGLGLSEGTVKIHLKALFKSLKVRNRAAAAVAGTKLLVNIDN